MRYLLLIVFIFILPRAHGQSVGASDIKRDTTVIRVTGNKIGVDTIKWVASKYYVDSIAQASGGGNKVDTIWRIAGIDSIYFTINGTQYAIKDSVGSGASGGVDSIWRTVGVDSIYFTINAIQYAIKDSVGGGTASLDTLKAGYGLSGNDYNGTSTETWIVDSAKFATVYDAALKLNIADTATMLAPYMLYGDTTYLSNRIDLKLNISDTASMLAPYLKESDTLGLSNRINLKLNISDTAAMLNPYLRKADTLTLSNRINLKLNIADTATMLANYYNTTDTIPVSRGGTGSASDSIARLTLGVPTVNDAITLLGAPSFKTKTLGKNFTEIAATGTITSGLLLYIALDQVPSGTVLTGAKIYIATGLSGTVLSSGNCRIGLATYSGGTYTMVDSTANDSTLFKGTSNGYTGANFVTPYTTSGETALFAVIIYKTGGTSTTFTIGATSSFNSVIAAGSGLFTNSAKVYGTISGQSFMPSTQAASGLTAQAGMVWIGIY